MVYYALTRPRVQNPKKVCSFTLTQTLRDDLEEYAWRRGYRSISAAVQDLLEEALDSKRNSGEMQESHEVGRERYV